jgi:hypothetical protein
MGIITSNSVSTMLLIIVIAEKCPSSFSPYLDICSSTSCNSSI